jgi:hypothetical protein
MRYFILVLFLGFLLWACDDGDIITVELEFDKELQRCDNNTEDFLLYDVISDPNESLSLIFPRDEITEALFTTVISEDDPVTRQIDGNNTRFIYRTYNRAPDFCQIINDGDLVITGDYEAESGTFEAWTALVDSDDDGIPTVDEDENLDGDNDPATNPTDTDGDDIPNYLDQDDDNDNVLTALEDDDDDNDDNPFTNARDTDGDGTPDYLDKDDDGDGTDTILEDENGDQNLFNDFDLESPNLNTPRFLDPEADADFEGGNLINNEYTREYTTTFIVNEVNLGIINYTRLLFGTYVTTQTVSSND